MLKIIYTKPITDKPVTFGDLKPGMVFLWGTEKVPYLKLSVGVALLRSDFAYWEDRSFTCYQHQIIEIVSTAALYLPVKE